MYCRYSRIEQPCKRRFGQVLGEDSEKKKLELVAFHGLTKKVILRCNVLAREENIASELKLRALIASLKRYIFHSAPAAG